MTARFFILQVPLAGVSCCLFSCFIAFMLSFSQMKIAAGEESGDIGTNDGNEHFVLKLEEFVIDHDSTSANGFQKFKRDSEIVDSGDLDRGTNPAEEVTYPEVSDMQVVGYVRTGWKVVWHEESNQSYYWLHSKGQIKQLEVAIGDVIP